ncbi:MAG: DNA mismatch repair endonuclease MutL, partial [Clostridiales bacterium]|nr:DNA mismatch repair endonuclease MutL [Clostridiales bacterium]
MGKINVLKPNVFNMLAAGEVVERPSSVVKELIENSLDAGATEINVVIEQGGIRKIQVSDNGIGILKEDLRNAFLPHATSKLSNIDDLDSLATLGFRGEALASIASVSEVTLISASKSQGSASKITLSGGNVTFEGQDSRGEGTIITVENLFFNTPARLKFLKKPSAEGRQILDTVRMLVLANPNIRITLSDEEGIMLSSEGGTLADAICSVYGAKTVDKLRQICADSFGSIKVGGYISACDFTKPNRAYQTIIVNGRVVQDMTVQTAAEKAYGDYLMKRNYPMFVLDVVMPFDEVDSNVHPSKTEVRFVDKQRVFSAVYHAVLDTIRSSLGETKLGFDISN